MWMKIIKVFLTLLAIGLIGWGVRIMADAMDYKFYWTWALWIVGVAGIYELWKKR